MLEKISHAFSVLSDKQKRNQYDTYGTEEEMRENFTRGNGNFQNFNGFHGATFHFNGNEDFDPFVKFLLIKDIFDMFFNGGRARGAHNRRAAQR